jgi:hypothetical protein
MKSCIRRSDRAPEGAAAGAGAGLLVEFEPVCRSRRSGKARGGGAVGQGSTPRGLGFSV